jgi:small-conductance mechanosensitive channel
LQPLAISFSPIEVSSIAVAEFQTELELSDNSEGSEEKIALMAKLEEKERELGEVREQLQSSQAAGADELKAHETERAELKAALAERDDELEALRRKLVGQSATIDELRLQDKELLALRASLGQKDQELGAQASLIVELKDKERLRDEMAELRKSFATQSLLIEQLNHRADKPRLQDASQSSGEQSQCVVPASRAACRRTDSLFEGWRSARSESVLHLALISWRFALAEAKAWNAEECRAWLVLRLERCACGERDLWEVRQRDHFTAAQARRRRHAQEDAKERERDRALFPAGAGAFGTLLEQVHSGSG